MYKKIFSISLVVMLTACNSTSNSTADKSTVAAKNTKDMVCEHTPKTGSHLKKRKCMSKGLAAEIRRKNQEALRSQDRKGQTSAGVYQ